MTANTPRPKRTTSGSSGRAQTVQDFAIGASIFLLTVSFVFAFVPSIFAPFASEVQPGAKHMAARTGSAFIDEYSIEDSSGNPHRNWLSTDLQSTVVGGRKGPDVGGDGKTGDWFRNKYGLPDTAQVNITIKEIKDWEKVNPSKSKDGIDHVGGAGDMYNGKPAASVSRVAVVQGYPKCTPNDNTLGDVCRIVIRVW